MCEVFQYEYSKAVLLRSAQLWGFQQFKGQHVLSSKISLNLFPEGTVSWINTLTGGDLDESMLGSAAASPPRFSV